MKLPTFRILLVAVSMAILTACGGNPADLQQAAAPVVSESATVSSSQMVAGTGGTPLPDCAAQNCSQPRIVDGLAEEYRKAAMERSAHNDYASTGADINSPAAASAEQAM